MARMGKSFSRVLVAGLLATFMGYTGCADDKSGCLELSLEDVKIIQPAGVRVSFSMATCDNEPVPDMLNAIQQGAGEFTIINNETGKPFGSEGEAAPDLGKPKNFSFYAILLLDLSNSIVQPDNPAQSKLQEVLDGARNFIQQVVLEQEDPDLKFSVGIYVFGGTNNSQEWTEPDLGPLFTKDYNVLDERLKALEDDGGRGSTNLYGAFLKGLQLVRAQGSGEMVVRSLVILTDGTHETGDTDQMRVEAKSSLQDPNMPVVDSYSIAIEGDYNPDAIKELATDQEKNFFLVGEATELKQTFRNIATRVKAWSESNYVVGICSPLEGPNRSLTIKATRRGTSGELYVHYDATGFNLIGCDSNYVANPCQERNCGEVEGVLCGTCGGECCNPREVCQDGICVDVCQGRECGEVQGIDCGSCGSDKPHCTPDGHCVSSLTCPTDMVMIDALWVCIDRYEASRPDASATDQGSMTGAALSVPHVLPWSDVDWAAACAACEAAGKHLCTGNEWSAACSGPFGYRYPYGTGYDSDACNGGDSGSNEVLPTGDMSTCEGGHSGIYDMSGNLWEWTADCEGGQCSQMGGAWYVTGDNISCETTRAAGETETNANVGFRCCR